jgi:hypothetical protein
MWAELLDVAADELLVEAESVVDPHAAQAAAIEAAAISAAAGL